MSLTLDQVTVYDGGRGRLLKHMVCHLGSTVVN